MLNKKHYLHSSALQIKGLTEFSKGTVSSLTKETPDSNPIFPNTASHRSLIIAARSQAFKERFRSSSHKKQTVAFGQSVKRAAFPSSLSVAPKRQKTEISHSQDTPDSRTLVDESQSVEDTKEAEKDDNHQYVKDVTNSKEKYEESYSTETDDEEDPAPKAIIKSLFKPSKLSKLFTNSTTPANSFDFVFGQNLHERVEIDKGSTQNADNEKNENTLTVNENRLFASALETTNSKETEIGASKSEQDNDKISSSTSNNTSSQLSLAEAAKKYEEMKGAQKRKYEEVEIITGEENEENIVEMNCKLFTFENSNYEERGRGMLRLNDSKLSSRVVFRASGSHRLLLNTKVWHDQVCAKLNSKNLRITAFNGEGQLKIYLVQGRTEDIEVLFRELQKRIDCDSDEEGSEPANKKVAAVDE